LTNWFRCSLCDRVFMALGMRSHLHHAHGIPFDRIGRKEGFHHMGGPDERLMGPFIDVTSSAANLRILASWVRREA